MKTAKTMNRWTNADGGSMCVTRTETAGKRSSCTASQATTLVGEATFCLQNKMAECCWIPDGEKGIRD